MSKCDTSKSKHAYIMNIPLFCLFFLKMTQKIPLPEGMGTSPQKLSSALISQYHFFPGNTHPKLWMHVASKGDHYVRVLDWQFRSVVSPAYVQGEFIFTGCQISCLGYVFTDAWFCYKQLYCLLHVASGKLRHGAILANFIIKSKT
jgi:hypothetical protein